MDKASSLSLPLINLTFSLSFTLSVPLSLLRNSAFSLYIRVPSLQPLALKPRENLSSAFLAKGQGADQIDAFTFAVGVIISGDTRAG